MSRERALITGFALTACLVASAVHAQISSDPVLFRVFLSDGRVLCTYGDSGWGANVRDGKAAGTYSDILVRAMAELVRSWAPGGCISTGSPSRRATPQSITMTSPNSPTITFCGFKSR